MGQEFFHQFENQDCYILVIISVAAVIIICDKFQMSFIFLNYFLLSLLPPEFGKHFQPIMSSEDSCNRQNDEFKILNFEGMGASLRTFKNWVIIFIWEPIFNSCFTQNMSDFLCVNSGFCYLVLKHFQQISITQPFALSLNCATALQGNHTSGDTCTLPSCTNYMCLACFQQVTSL